MFIKYYIFSIELDMGSEISSSQQLLRHESPSQRCNSDVTLLRRKARREFSATYTDNRCYRHVIIYRLNIKLSLRSPPTEKQQKKQNATTIKKICV